MKEKIVKSYALEFKQSSAKLAATSEQSVSKTAKDLGVNVNTLHGWIRAYYPKGVKKEILNDNIEEEVKQLRRENARLRQERDILKKAAAYFANEIS